MSFQKLWRVAIRIRQGVIKYLAKVFRGSYFSVSATKGTSLRLV